MPICDPYLRRLVELWSPPSMLHHTGLLIGFDRIERELGQILPPSYKELVQTYGNGIWFDAIHIQNPFLAWLQNLEPWYIPTLGYGGVTWCKNLLSVREKSPEDFIYPVYPEAGGIFPWAFFYGIAGTLYWLPSGPPERWKSLFDLGSSFSQSEWEIFDMPVTELLWRLATRDPALEGTDLDKAIGPDRSIIFYAQ